MPAKNKNEYQRSWLQKRREMWISSQGGCCARCGSHEQLEVDHINHLDKTRKVSAIWSYSETRRLEELAKCQVLCHTCHRAKTVEEGSNFKNKQTVKPLEHGTYNGYQVHKCRCALCKGWKKASRKRHLTP